jgi:DNA (cytosine-5)-methyltransferase 1
MIMRKKVEDGVLTEEEAMAMMNGVTLRPPRMKQWMWPTPTAVSRPNEGNIRMLRKKVMSGEISREEAEQMVGKDVFEQQGKVQKIMWPTPTANEDACGRPGAKMQKMLGNHPEVRKPLNGGTLNPTWVEWLMGYPKGWTDLNH